MANNYTEDLFTAVDMLIDKRLEAIEKDNTILCVIDNASTADDGYYTVSNASVSFIAYSDNNTYKEGQNV